MRPPPIPCKAHVSATTPNRAFLPGFPATQFADFRLCDAFVCLNGDFWRLVSASKNSVPGSCSSAQAGPRLHPEEFRLLGHRNSGPWARAGYSGLSPSASNCRLHSAGGSRSRSTPMPRGRRPSTAALTRSGARKASEIVILTCRTLHFSRVQRSATVVTRPETTSSSQRRPRAMALTSRARRSNCSAGLRFEMHVREQDLAGFFGWRLLPGN